jgi:hypothetical protein
MGVSDQRHALATLYPQGKEAGWASELVWIQRLEGKSFASARDRTPVIQSVVRQYTN